MDLLSTNPEADLLPLTALVTAFTLAHADDDAAFRAGRSALRMLQHPVALAFDGVELRVLSEEKKNEGVEYVTDGETCTCPGKPHPWCKHRVIFRQLLALAVLRGPSLVRAAIVEQTVPPLVETLPAGEVPAPWDLDSEYLTWTYRPYTNAEPRSVREPRPLLPVETPAARAKREMAELFA
jgi:hypothetical protein